MAAKQDLNLDPDYEALPSELQEKRIKLFEDSMRNHIEDKITNVLKSNIEQEINSKDAEIDALDDNLNTCKAILDRLRACVITKFYATLGQDQKPEEGFVPSLHPTIKKHMNQNMLHNEKPPHDHTIISESSKAFNINNSGGTIKLSFFDGSSASNQICNNIDFDRNFGSLNKDNYGASRLKTKYKIVVGNISKFIPVWQRNESDQSTHKWMVYVRGDKGHPDIEGVVKKVKFLLHPSYRPNDIIEINTPPFHLVKRGWGEFPVRVQLHFQNVLNKPVDIIHNLKLDKTFTGLQTLGAETVVDLQLFKNESCLPTPTTSFNSPSTPSTSSNQSVTSNAKNPSLSFNSKPDLVFPVKMEIEIDEESSTFDTISFDKPSEIKPNSEINKNSVSNVKPICDETISTSNTSNPSQLVTSNNESQTNSLPIKSVLIKKDITLNGVNTSYVKCAGTDGRVVLLSNSLCFNADKLNALKTKNNNIVNIIPKTGDVSNTKVIRPPYFFKVVPNIDNSQQQVVLIPISDKKVQCKDNKLTSGQIDKSVITNNVQDTKSVSTIEPPEKKPKPCLRWEQEVANIKLENYKSFVELLTRITKIFPLVKEGVDRNSYPFCAKSLEEYLRWNIGKQRASEWRRAGLIRSSISNIVSKNMVPYITKESIWSRRDIMLWCRKNGFVPMTTEKMSLLPEPKWSGVELCSITSADHLLSSLKEESHENTASTEDEELEVVELVVEKSSKPEKKSNQLSAFHMPPLNEASLYVKDVASQVGVNIKTVESEPSICVPVIEEMMLAACRELATSLIRNATSEGFNRLGGKMCPEEITVSDVYSAIKNNKQFNFLSSNHLGKPKISDEDT